MFFRSDASVEMGACDRCCLSAEVVGGTFSASRLRSKVVQDVEVVWSGEIYLKHVKVKLWLSKSWQSNLVGKGMSSDGLRRASH